MSDQNDGSSRPVFCTNCGAESASDGAFCPGCGHRVDTSDVDGITQPPSLSEPDEIESTAKAGERVKPHRRGRRISLISALVLIVIVGVGAGGMALAAHHRSTTKTNTSAMCDSGVSQDPVCFSSPPSGDAGTSAAARTFDSSSPSSISPCDLINFTKAGNYWMAPFGKVTTTTVNNGTTACVGYLQGTTSQYVEIVVIPTPVTEATFPEQVSSIMGPLDTTGLPGPWEDGFYKYSPSQDLAGGVILKGSTVVAVLAIGSSGFNQSFVSYFLTMAAGHLS